MFSKIDVKGPNMDPIYGFLKSEGKVGEIGWNFEKFLVGKDGHIAKHYATKVTPGEIEKDIVDLLG